MKGGAIGVLAVVILLWGLAVNVSTAKYSGGTGEPNDPYRIATPNDLNDIGNHIEDFNKCFVLAKDIDMAAYTFTAALIAPDINNATDYFQGTMFKGTFDGNDCAIRNLTIDTRGAGSDYLGLFGTIYQTGTIKDLGVVDMNISAANDCWFLGGLCGLSSYGSTISNCYVSGCLTSGDNSRFVGGLCGKNWFGAVGNCCADVGVSCGDGSVGVGGFCGEHAFGTISNSQARGCVSGGVDCFDVGGFCGVNQGMISNCFATGSVRGAGGVWFGCRYLAGFCGRNHRSTLSYCYATGTVSGGDNSWSIGGLCGINFMGTIVNCYAAGSVSGGIDSQSVGGLCGHNHDGTISKCYAAGRTVGDCNVGGLVGRYYPQKGDYTGCFWDSDINPDVNGIGNTNEPNVIGKTTAEMMMESTFTDAGWDFVEVWDIGENQTYPFLRVYPAGDMNHDGIVDWRDFAILAGHWLESVE